LAQGEISLWELESWLVCGVCGGRRRCVDGFDMRQAMREAVCFNRSQRFAASGDKALAMPKWEMGIRAPSTLVQSKRRGRFGTTC